MNVEEVTPIASTTRHFTGRSAGHNNGIGTWVIGPVLVTIEVIEYAAHTASYYVSLDGRHQFGGFAHHMRDGLPEASFLEIGRQITTHTIRWFGVIPGTGERVPRNSHMNGGDWGWDATCSCGWDSRTGGAIQERVREYVQDHKVDVR